MSQQLISRSADLKRLRDEGYDIEIRSSYLLVKHVPYVNAQREVKFGTLVSALTLAGEVTTTPSNHVVTFAGEHPCNKDGSPMVKIVNQSQQQQLDAGLVVHHTFSSKPLSGSYNDYYEKMTTYATILASPAQSIDPTATARTFPVFEATEIESVFNYTDTASSRADIVAVTRKLELEKIAIVGLGGTGSYVLDLVAKTPVKEIHPFDGDKLLQHNAFRAPGAPSAEELRQAMTKVAYFHGIYSKMHRHIVPHEYFLDGSNVHKLEGMSFVFLCIDDGTAKRAIVEYLEQHEISFVDVGMGIHLVDGALLGVLRVTASTPTKRDHVWSKGRIPFSSGDGHNEYAKNIQIAELNALNATLAVVKWKKLFGFYHDFDNEHFSTYTIDGNMLTNEDRPDED
jgi:hypothetical protein